MPRTQQVVGLVLTLLLLITACSDADGDNSGAANLETQTTDLPSTPTTNATTAPSEPPAPTAPTTLDTPTTSPTRSPTIALVTPTALPPLEITDCTSDDEIRSFIRAFVDAFNAESDTRLVQFLPVNGQVFAGFQLGDFSSEARQEVLDFWARRHAEDERWTIQDIYIGSNARLHRNAGGGPDVTIVVVQFIREARDLSPRTVIGRTSVNCMHATVEDWWSDPHPSGSVVEDSVIGEPEDAPTPVAPPTMTDVERDARFNPGPPWDDSRNEGISQEEAESFAEHPIFWLGESYAGYNLQVIRPYNYPPPENIPDHAAMSMVAVTYGECVIQPGNTSCSPPIQIQNEPICTRPPSNFAGNVTFETARGEAQLIRWSDGQIMLWTGQVTITIHVPFDASMNNQIVQELRGLNSDTQAGEPLPPPDISQCQTE